jgi:hypothetical protein
VQPPAVPEAFTPTIVEIVSEPDRGLSMIDVAVAAFGLTGVIMAAAVVAGLIAGPAFIWFRQRHAVSTIEARGHQHDLFKA